MEDIKKDVNRLDKLSFEEKKLVSEKFMFLWEQYNKITNLSITLIVGTLLIFARNVFHSDNLELFKAAPLGVKWLAGLSVFSLFCGLLFSISWRILSQIIMEQDVFGNKDSIVNYQKEMGLDHGLYYFDKDNSWVRKLWKVTQYLVYLFLLLGWIFFLVFTFLL